MNRRRPRRIDQVEPGFYEYRRVRGGPLMPARISIENGMIFMVEGDSLRVGMPIARYEDMVVEATIGGRAFDEPLLKCAWFGEPITKREHNRLMGILAVARERIPDHPMLFPDRPVQIRDIKIDLLF